MMLIITMVYIFFITIYTQRFIRTDIDNKVSLEDDHHQHTIQEKNGVHLLTQLQNPPIPCPPAPCSENTFLSQQQDDTRRIKIPSILMERADTSISSTVFELSQYSTMKEALIAYTKFHNSIVSQIKAGNVDSSKILVVEPKEGWGNVIRAITSSLYVAMITGRALFIDLHPFPFDRYFKQVNIEWQWLEEYGHRGINCQTFRLDVGRTCKECWQNLDTMKKQDLHTVFDQKQRCYRVVTFSPLQEWLVENPFHRGLFRRFNSIQDWQAIYEYFISEPTDLVKNTAEPYEKQFKEASIVYGVHIRSGKGEAKEERFLAPATLTKLKQCTRIILEKSLASDDPKNKKPLFFVTADDVVVITSFEEHLGSANVVHTEGMAGHSIKNPNFELKAVVDWYLLTKTDIIFATIFSSFSKTAHEVHNNW
jgi:hypothetical protein